MSAPRAPLFAYCWWCSEVWDQETGEAIWPRTYVCPRRLCPGCRQKLRVGEVEVRLYPTP